MNGTLQSVLHPAGADAAVISQFTWVLFGAGTLIFVAVMALLVLSLRDNAKPLRPGLWIAGAGVAFPVLVLSALLVWSTWRSAQLVPQSSNTALGISVTARMWWWEVRYRDPGSGREIVTANEIHVPVGQTVYVGLNTADVIHSLWVPALSGKRDMIPGRVTGLTLRADQPASIAASARNSAAPSTRAWRCTSSRWHPRRSATGCNARRSRPARRRAPCWSAAAPRSSNSGARPATRSAAWRRRRGSAPT